MFNITEIGKAIIAASSTNDAVDCNIRINSDGSFTILGELLCMNNVHRVFACLAVTCKGGEHAELSLGLCNKDKGVVKCFETIGTVNKDLMIQQFSSMYRKIKNTIDPDFGEDFTVSHLENDTTIVASKGDLVSDYLTVGVVRDGKVINAYVVDSNGNIYRK